MNEAEGKRSSGTESPASVVRSKRTTLGGSTALQYHCPLVPTWARGSPLIPMIPDAPGKAEGLSRHNNLSDNILTPAGLRGQTWLTSCRPQSGYCSFLELPRLYESVLPPRAFAFCTEWNPGV